MDANSPHGFPFAIVGFDLDGTLLDTSGDLTAAVNHALATIGRAPLSVEAVKPMIGGGARAMLQHGLDATGGYDADTLDRLHRLLLDYYEANLAVHTAPFPGAIEALDELAARGVTLGIMTNKLERFARAILDSLGLTERFASIIGGDTLGVSKPSPRPIQALVEQCGGGPAAFVGDSIFDVQAARAAGLPVIACSFGFLSLPVEALGADAIIDGYADLIPTLTRLSLSAT
ncbi:MULTISPECIES: HAD-IA family hydrolase [Sphingomonas]|jgi:phosphoglycolate phosphatase|uniref:Phosphoglycolate phosphatase n=1 Tax=Sphingomonas zeae TaxID=1646122 RepID=A0A7Y6EI22_9SPHN|nr:MULTISPECIES: HAD-IA family hydrolase [Sphingomonas]MBB4047654.1 phosphoglycolate phosphatase [Sphingomonas zeae]MDK8185617.1 HAD-IA family hydrolase [Sphingomonas zeae]MDK8216638.1 HAD-IA family hydrolase [Sphingomonas sp. UMB7805-LC452B]NUU47677.1 HAD-IA family hydrolase [Sphingomonas zeae]